MQREQTLKVVPGSKFPLRNQKLYVTIWEMVACIPRGRVSTYGQIAEFCGIPGQPRLVGYALHNLPRGSSVPWHRVINAKGQISLSDLDGKYEEQKKLLKKEGVRFIKETVDINKFGWMFHSSTKRRKR